MKLTTRLLAISGLGLLASACATPSSSTTGAAAPAAAVTTKPAELPIEHQPSVLMSLIQTGRCEELHKRLEAGAPIPPRDAAGYTALGLASSHLHGACMFTLLEHGADVNEPIAGGWTPLILIAMGGSDEVLLDLLLDRGATIDAQNRWGCTALYYATGFGAIRTVNHLIERGASVPGTGGDCITPMKLAQLRGYPDIVKRFEALEAGGASTAAGSAAPAATAAAGATATP